MRFVLYRQYLQAVGILLPTTVVGVVSIFVAAGSNYVLIYGIGSWHGLGFVGSPIATVIASWFQPIALFSYAILYKHHHHRACCQTWSSGDRSHAVISGLWGLLWALFWGYGCATQVRVANYLGAGKPDLARRITGLGFICTMVVVALIATITSVMDRRIIALYTTDQELLRTCQPVLPIFVAACALEAVEILGAGALTGMSITMGYGFPALWVGVLSMELFKVGSYSMALANVHWSDMAERVKEAAEAAPEMEQSTAQFVAAAADIQPTTPPTTPPLVTPRRRLREEELRMMLKSKVRPINGQSVKSMDRMGDANGDAPLGKWAMRKEARRNMYATSTDQVRVHRRGLGASTSSAAAMCQKCLKPGHWTYECKNEAVYVQRPSRSQQLKNPKLRQPFNQEKPPELREEEAEKSTKLKRKDKDKGRAKAKKTTKSRSKRRKRRSVSSSSESSSSDSSSSDSESDSDSSSSSSSSSSESSSSDSDSSSSSGSDRRRRRIKRRRRD
eukprot:jgi/Phyca11/17584/fgenesh1_pg.PHYCAscaffold_29_\